MGAGKTKQTIKVGEGLCGQSMSADYSFMNARRNCQDCKKYSNVIRSCLRCNKPFRPGCKTTHTCARCASGKKAVEEKSGNQWNYFV